MHDGVRESIVLTGQSLCHYNVAMSPELLIR